MADERLLNELRQRLYATYTTTQAGVADPTAQRPGFTRDIRPHLPLDRGARILDLGCGQGHYVRELLALGYGETRGIDVSPEQVQEAQAAGLTQVTLGDYRESLGVAELDVVIATDFLEHLTRFEALAALDQSKRALRPGGTLILRVPNAGSPFSGAIRYGDLTHEQSFTAQSLRQLGLAAGFGTITIYECLPPIHGVKSGIRAGAWWAAAAVMKMALIAETGQLRGHAVTQNIVAVMHVNAPKA